MDRTAPVTTRPAIGDREFVVLMASLMALVALSIDSMLPALPQIARDLGVSDPNRRQLVIGVYLFAAAFGALLPGVLADRFGRRPVLFSALISYTVLAAACSLAQSLEQLLVIRALQAFLAAGLTVLPNAIIRDTHEGDAMARMMSTTALVFMAVPMIAPSYGQAVLAFAGWRWIFGCTAILSAFVGLWAWLRLPETLDPANRQSVHLGTMARNMWLGLSARGSIGYVLGGGVLWAGMFGFLNSSQQLIGEHFGAAERFPLFFALLAGSMAVANLTNSRIVERFGARRVSHTALFAFIAVAILQVWRAFSGTEQLWDFVLLQSMQMCLIAFMGANFTSIAMQPFSQIAGAASSVQMFVRSGMSALLGGLVGQAYDGSARPLAMALLTGGLLALALVLYSEHGRLFRRLNAPGTKRPVLEVAR